MRTIDQIDFGGPIVATYDNYALRDDKLISDKESYSLFVLEEDGLRRVIILTMSLESAIKYIEDNIVNKSGELE